MPEEYIYLKEAMNYLGVSKPKMIRLAKENNLKTFEDPVDKRKTFFLKADIEKLKLKSLRLKI